MAQTASTPAATPFFQTEVDYQLTIQDGSTRLVRLSQMQAVQGISVAASGPVAVIAVTCCACSAPPGRRWVRKDL